MPNLPKRSKIHPLAYGGAVLTAVILLGLAMLLLQWSGRQSLAQAATLTPLPVTVIPAPTETPLIITPTGIMPATPTSAPILPPGVMAVGAYVKVSNTGGAGVRIRHDATTDSLTQFIAMDEEVFEVIGGPVEKNAFTWWQLAAPYDKNRTGWAAQEYLTLIDLPTPTP
ncbi:MAG: hypothetical protein VB108_01695 [Anaerolineaceae bacterium]|nr:hypothetical protein [Anaerolineaceae bacterium]